MRRSGGISGRAWPQSGLLCQQALKGLPQCVRSRIGGGELRQCAGRRFQGAALVCGLGLAQSAIVRGRQVRQRQARQYLQSGVGVQHLAAFTPCAIKHDEPQRARCGRRARPRRAGCQAQRAAVGCWRVQQNAVARHIVRVPWRVQPVVQLHGVELFTHFQSAALQAQVQQARRALGLQHFRRVL